jgi:bifunctional UDP-N-acetylglucosamine pyrophosphorylase/glucosamine-1-phosphate N-acetyltransferase
MKTACVILAAGEGKRMRTRLPKVMHEVCSEPMIYYPVRLALQRGYRPVVVVTGNPGEAVRGFLADRFGDRVRFAVQDPPRGTGHAVMSAKKALKGFSGKLVILYGDVPLLQSADLAALERSAKRAAVAFLTCMLEDPTGYGRVVRDERGRPVRIVEQTDADAAERRIPEINAGIYLVQAPEVFSALKEVGRNNKQGEYYLTDLIELARRKGRVVRAVQRKGSRELLGVNDRRELAEAHRRMSRRLVDRLLAQGVTIVDPDRTYLGPEVKIGRDTVLFPDCVIRQKVKIGSGCRIGPGAVIQNARIESGAEIRPYSVLEDCRVGKGCLVGPFARLRPGAVLLDDARVGNFVEVKKTTVGRGSKANHLTYLGDTVIGSGVNVGAGTITCNYDGVNKYPTIIEDGVFIGSDTQLVAPVTVGKNAIIGAGTTVTGNVPEDSLAVSRVPQTNIKGYAKRKRRKRS